MRRDRVCERCANAFSVPFPSDPRRFCCHSCSLPATSVCSVDDCSRTAKGRGLCGMHYQRMRKTGSTARPKDRRPQIVGDVAHIPLTQGLSAVVDVVDLPLVESYLWSTLGAPGHGPYALTRGIDPAGPGTLMHRVIASALDGQIVDHVDHDTLNNRRGNLRVGRTQDNSRNLTLRMSNKSGYIGVDWRPDRRRWRAYVGISGRLHHVGHFLTSEDAARARDAYIREHAPSEFWSYNYPLPGEQAADPTHREIA